MDDFDVREFSENDLPPTFYESVKQITDAAKAGTLRGVVLAAVVVKDNGEVEIAPGVTAKPVAVRGSAVLLVSDLDVDALVSRLRESAEEIIDTTSKEVREIMEGRKTQA